MNNIELNMKPLQANNDNSFIYQGTKGEVELCATILMELFDIDKYKAITLYISGRPSKNSYKMILIATSFGIPYIKITDMKSDPDYSAQLLLSVGRYFRKHHPKLIDTPVYVSILQ